MRVVTDSYERLAVTAPVTTHLASLPSAWTPWQASRGSRAADCPVCCSSAAATPDARSSPRPCSPTAPRDM
ncbi:hypothetical protein [Streptomyces sp900116325]|uniref:hypothetical protein n=1 Tax=Streptomyces sp. 900116325 TaxID=3154295 RepID=UPI0033AC6E7A